MDHSMKIEMPNVASDHSDDGQERQSNEQHVKRPMNAFMVWAKTERRQLAMRLPGMPNSEVSKLLGEMWRQLPDEQKSKYRSESERIRKDHKQKHPDYRYHPNRHSRKQKVLDANSPLAASLINSSRQPQQQRSLTPNGANPRMMNVKDQERPHSAPPATLRTMGAPMTNASVSSWWSPASTPPTSSFGSGMSATSLPTYQTMPGSPTQDLGSAGIASPSSVAWGKQHSPADSTNSSKQRASPCQMLDQQRNVNQSPLVGARQGSSLNNSSSSVNVPVGGSLMPAVSGAYYDNKTTMSYMAQPDQPTSTVSFRSADFHRVPGVALSTTKTAVPAQVSTSYDGSVPVVNGTEQRNDSVLAPGTLFYPAYQPTAYLPSAYNWLDNRAAATFVLPEQIANTAQHSQMYHQQSVAS